MQGFYTVETLCTQLNISRTRAVYLIHKLRELGLVKTSYVANRKRLYYISINNRQTSLSYTDLLNRNSPIKLASFEPYFVHGRTPSYEEVLIYALKQRNIRYIIASLSLFRKISNWSKLYHLAKKENLLLEVVVLYELSRRIVKKVKRMPLRFLNLVKKNIPKKPIFIVDKFSSNDYQDIERKWNVYIPLNASDLESYKGVFT